MTQNLSDKPPADTARQAERPRLLPTSNDHGLDLESQFRGIFENAVEGIYQTTVDGHYIIVNPALAQIYGFASPTALIDGLTNIAGQLYVDPTRRDDFKRAMAEAGVVRNFEAQVYRADHSVIWITENARCVRAPDGTILYYEGTVEDITQRKSHEETIRLRDRALEGISQGIAIADYKTPGMPITYTNPTFATLSRYSIDEIIGRGLTSFFEADVSCHFEELLSKARAQKRALRLEGRLKRKDGTSFLDSLTLSFISGEDGEITHAVAVHDDITELRQREELLLESQKMESIGQLTGGIAHDFNNLLTVIKSNAEDLRDDLTDNPLLQSQAGIVLEAADRGAGLVAHLMAFARKQELQPKTIDVNALLDTFTKLMRSTLPAHIEIVTQKATALPPVYVDPRRLESAILNLAVNARDAMPNGGTITIETTLKTLDAGYIAEHIEVREGNYVLIALTDTGSGMTREVVERAFTPFFTTKEVGRGTGLGLSMVYGFVKQSGGHATIYSEVGLGTVVKLYLPALEHAEISDVPETGDEKIQSGSGSILLVEDDPILRRSAASKLSRLGYDVVAAGNAMEAIAILESTPHFDLIFSDVIMPGPMSGVDLVREVARRWPAVNVLLTSGYTELTVSGKLGLPTDVKLLSKPYSTREVAKVISETIRGSRSKVDAV